MSNTLVTTTLRIPKEELLMYRQYALNQGKSLSQLAREGLARLVMPVKTPVSFNKKRSLWDIDKYSITLGDPKASQTIDDTVYAND